MHKLAKIYLRIANQGQGLSLKFIKGALVAVIVYTGASVPTVAMAFDSVSGIRLLERLTGVGSLAELRGEQPPPYGPQLPPTLSETLTEICQERGYGEDCAKILLGMAWKESNLKGSAIGDYGAARGYFQIHYRLHNVPLSCAQDLRCSANWTIDYLEYNGYPRYRHWAVQCHNGCGINNGYAYSVFRHGERLWPKAQDSRSGNQLAVR